MTCLKIRNGSLATGTLSSASIPTMSDPFTRLSNLADAYCKGLQDAGDGGNGFAPEYPNDNSYMGPYFAGYRAGSKQQNAASEAIHQFWRDKS